MGFERGPSLAPASAGWAQAEPQGPRKLEPGGGLGSWLWPAQWRLKEAPPPALPCQPATASPSLPAPLPCPAPRPWVGFRGSCKIQEVSPRHEARFRKTNHLLLPLDFSFGSGFPCPRAACEEGCRATLQGRDRGREAVLARRGQEGRLHCQTLWGAGWGRTAPSPAWPGLPLGTGGASQNGAWLCGKGLAVRVRRLSGVGVERFIEAMGCLRGALQPALSPTAEVQEGAPQSRGGFSPFEVRMVSRGAYWWLSGAWGWLP